MQRSIPVNSGGHTGHITLNDTTTRPWESPAQAERINLSHHIEAPDPREARDWAKGGMIGGALLAGGIGIVCAFGMVITRDIEWAWTFAKVWTLPAIGYITPLIIRFALRCFFDNRVRKAMPPPRSYVATKGKASHIIEGRKVGPAVDLARIAHLHKLYTLALWAASEQVYPNGYVKAYGYAPRLRRDDKGVRELVVEATGDVIHQEDQEQLHAELEAVEIFTKHGQRWGLTDLTWTPDDVVSRMEAAFPDD